MNNQDLINKYITKKFSSRAKGYDPHEVDSFLDDLIKKIRELTSLNEALVQKNSDLDNEIIQLKQLISEKEGIINCKDTQIEELYKSGYHNEAMLRRLKTVEDQLSNQQQSNQQQPHQKK